MSVYGYSKPTTPNLDRLQKEGSLFVFADVISPHNQTNLSLKKVLSFSNYENESIPWQNQQNLVATMKHFGYKTMWLSNQEPPLYASPSSITASLADQAIFISQHKQRLDAELLPYLKEGQSRGARFNFYVLHLMGSHMKYSLRYPSSFEYFKASSLAITDRRRAEYANTILYNDYVVSEIFKVFSKSDSIVIYLSDHGEEVHERGEFCGHAEGIESRFMVEIPMMIYLSDTFKQKHPQVYKRIQKSLSRPYMSDDLMHTILDIAGIEGFDPKRSVIHDSFDTSRKRIVGGKDYDKELRFQEAK